MSASRTERGIDHAIADVASRQYGIATRRQLVDAGVSRGAIAYRLTHSRLYRLHSGVYAVGYVPRWNQAHWLAAVLACGPTAVLSHRSAAALWEIREGEGPRPDVTVASRSGRRHPGIVIHRSRLEPVDITIHEGIPVTTPTRTFSDLARELDDDDLDRALYAAERLGLFDLDAIRELLARRPSRRLQALID